MIPDELQKDADELKARGFDLSLVECDDRIYLVFKDFPLPENVYSSNAVDLLIFTTPCYPCDALDMFWTESELVLKDGTIPRSAGDVQTYIGRQWRQFSYHPYQNTKWDPSVDNVVKYVGYIHQRLQKGD